MQALRYVGAMDPSLRQQLITLAGTPGLPDALRGPLVQAMVAEAEAAETWPSPHGDGGPGPVEAPEHLEILGLVGRGGMGEVWRARDKRLNAVVALKTVRSDLATNAMICALFDAEARVTASLAHPGIPPVHERGDLRDGRPFYTMKLLIGRSLAELLEARAPLGRLVGVLRQACDAVGHAHTNGVIHRDLKPDNIHVASNDEVLVLDWGIARAAPRGKPGHGKTGTAGTIGYMAPEQAAGDRANIGPASDVWSIGRMLQEVLDNAINGPGEDDARREELAAVARRATRTFPLDRYSDGRALAEDLARWLVVGERRARAREVLAEADEALASAVRLRHRAEESRVEARLMGAASKLSDPEPKKREFWASEDRAAGLERAAVQHELEAEVLVSSSLTHADLPEARARLATMYRERHAAAEAARDPEANRWELLLRTHDRGEHARYLEGAGTIDLITEPAGAEATLFRYTERDRRLVPVSSRRLGQTPLIGVEVGHGSWLVELRLEGRCTVRHPLFIARNAHVAAPVDHPIRLPAVGELGPDDCVVTPGWTMFGADASAPNQSGAERSFHPGCVLRRFPVTNLEYLAFLNDLVAKGQADRAEVHVPREARANAAGGRPLYTWTGVRWELGVDADGDAWQPDWPVIVVTFDDAEAFAAWEAKRTGQPWRLPDEREWERAARGADGRYFPWGNFLDPSFALFRESWPADARPQPRPIQSYPLDESPFGVRGLAGGVRDWCYDAFGDQTSWYERLPALRGGAWNLTRPLLRAANRSKSERTAAVPSTGFRLARGL